MLSEMLETNVVRWTSKIMGNARRGLIDQALACFLQMRHAGIEPNAITYSVTISVCAQSARSSLATSLHCLILKKGFSNQLFVSSGLISMYSKHDCIKEARFMFDGMPERDDAAWNSMIAGYSQRGLNEEACGLFCSMINSCENWKLLVKDFTLATVLKACGGLGCSRIGKCVHGYAVKIGFDSDLFVSASTIHMYCKCGILDLARRVFDQIENKDIVAWNTMITGYAQNCCEEEAIELFYQMELEGFKSNDTTFCCVLNASTSMSDSAVGRCFHAKVLKLGCSMDVFVATALVDMYSKFYDIEDVERAFGEMSKRNLVSFNALITGYSLRGKYEQALRVYSWLQSEGMEPDSFTFVGLFSAFSVYGTVVEGAQVHVHAIKFGLDSDISVGNSIVNLYSKCGLSDSALEAFESINGPNSVCWAGIISGFAQNGEGEKALVQFCEMHKLFNKADEFSSSSVIKAVSSWVVVEQGRHLHAHVMKSGLDCTIYVGSALIDMYSKCGMVEDAWKVFSVMPEKNAVSWNSMITGYAQNGFCKEALLLFQEMMSSGILPTAVTFVGILFACSHAGLVEEGRNFYNLMVNYYGILASMEHCTCMVDLLGRAGYLEEAEAFLLNSSFSKEPGIWGSLLSACGIHKNSDVGSRAAQHCLFLDPHGSSSYTNLSNMYASKELWSEASRIRALMKEMGVEKEPGCSWIETLRFGVQ